MKKIFAAVLSALMIFTLSACGDGEKNSSSSESKIAVADSSLINETAGDTLLREFVDTVQADPSMSAQAVADAIVSSDLIKFKTMTAPVEEGMLTGFGNTEITGFKEGIMFGPSVSSIPFIGYIFVIKDDTDLILFMNNLIKCADKNWNVCTEADSVNVDNVESTVFFLMCPDSLEEE